MISKTELMTLLNVAWTDAEILDRIDGLAEALTDGTLRVVNDGDAVSALRITELGKTYLPPALPTATA
jgi:hypothetical protein